MPSSRVVCALVALAALAGPATAKDKVVRVTLGPFRIEAKRDREVCQAVRIPKVPGMEVVSYEVRSLSSQRGNVGTHHMVVYGYDGPNGGAFTFRKNARDVVDIRGCKGFGPAEVCRSRGQVR